MLRGINLGPNRRVPMADLRALFGEAGYEDVRTYVQSGNIVLESTAKPAELEREAAALICERFGFDVPVVVRTRARARGGGQAQPARRRRRRAQALPGELPPDKPAADVVKTLKAAAVEPERVVFHGREIYAWHPEGVARSKLWNALAGKGLGVTATARNWTTVTTLLEMAGG